MEAVQQVLKERDEARAKLAAYHREDEKDSKLRVADIALFEARIERLTKVLRNVLWVARGASGSRKENRTGVDTLSTFGHYYEHDLRDGFPLLPLEDAFGHALSNIEMRVEEALGIGPEDEVEHDEVEETP